mmetsp:Transcript_165192/g.530164  ORF Transcript_165192/g.530164 Transcript_165192/m.530164 type:complete len:557 (+) Transcript_165192:561-2231(+)
MIALLHRRRFARGGPPRREVVRVVPRHQHRGKQRAHAEDAERLSRLLGAWGRQQIPAIPTPSRLKTSEARTRNEMRSFAALDLAREPNLSSCLRDARRPARSRVPTRQPGTWTCAGRPDQSHRHLGCTPGARSARSHLKKKSHSTSRASQNWQRVGRTRLWRSSARRPRGTSLPGRRAWRRGRRRRRRRRSRGAPWTASPARGRRPMAMQRSGAPAAQLCSDVPAPAPLRLRPAWGEACPAAAPEGSSAWPPAPGRGRSPAPPGHATPGPWPRTAPATAVPPGTAPPTPAPRCPSAAGPASAPRRRRRRQAASAAGPPRRREDLCPAKAASPRDAPGAGATRGGGRARPGGCGSCPPCVANESSSAYRRPRSHLGQEPGTSAFASDRPSSRASCCASRAAPWSARACRSGSRAERQSACPRPRPPPRPGKVQTLGAHAALPVPFAQTPPLAQPLLPSSVPPAPQRALPACPPCASAARAPAPGGAPDAPARHPPVAAPRAPPPPSSSRPLAPRAPFAASPPPTSAASPPRSGRPAHADAPQSADACAPSHPRRRQF